MTLDRLWAGWRAEYVGSVGAEVDDSGCLFCVLAESEPDEALVVARSDRTFAVLNAYPYTSGHLMVAPLLHESELDALGPEDAASLMSMVQRACTAVKASYAPDGLNVGANLGRAAGAGVTGHLHVHVVPRWVGDTNFMTATAEARVLPEWLPTTLERLRAAWP
ncbi:MAG: HIT domain-containing protein [Actinobacteria bacterium]|nr:HIT domain-containing protein [Actinomycetota bacterium]